MTGAPHHTSDELAELVDTSVDRRLHQPTFPAHQLGTRHHRRCWNQSC
ncbi:hypothetical protein ACTXOW_14785 [Corynebacterium variabile]|uniref:Uncharacterized protein n=1 Tax=Corynebacterium variabile (strain DSM 44702 / CIP 107183 / JCM 12073 / NCIMB 30131) TaxID=858619 RepID=G0HHQ5_CORVD|nr:hypothetical protein [Corynebacterium variabile]AEK37775.1 hypothetical protein CVAR_2430 [Corynebacterium variabile DSM 44702]